MRSNGERLGLDLCWLSKILGRARMHCPATMAALKQLHGLFKKPLRFNMNNLNYGNLRRTPSREVLVVPRFNTL